MTKKTVIHLTDTIDAGLGPAFNYLQSRGYEPKRLDVGNSNNSGEFSLNRSLSNEDRYHLRDSCYKIRTHG